MYKSFSRCGFQFFIVYPFDDRRLTRAAKPPILRHGIRTTATSAIDVNVSFSRALGTKVPAVTRSLAYHKNFEKFMIWRYNYRTGIRLKRCVSEEGVFDEMKQRSYSRGWKPRYFLWLMDFRCSWQPLASSALVSWNLPLEVSGVPSATFSYFLQLPSATLSLTYSHSLRLPAAILSR
jgi:hypothetical protein